MIIAYVGSGGKTSTIMAEAKRLRGQGRRVLIATTTHMLATPETIIGDDPEPILRALSEKGLAMAGTDAGGGKIGPLSPACRAQVFKAADDTLIEADGSRGLPLKFPAAHEPVVPEEAEEIVVIAGLSAIGKPLSQVCHRLPLAMDCLGIGADERVTAAHVQRLVEEGYVRPLSKKHPEKKIRRFPCQRDTLYLRAVGALIEAGAPADCIRPEWFGEREKLVVCGAGHVGTALACMAAQVGFDVTSIDDRAELARAERLPGVRSVVHADYARLPEFLSPGAYYAVMTHGHAFDQLCVEAILRRGDHAYAGMMGSRAKTAKTWALLRERGIGEAMIDSLHAPIGLAIGAVTPAEIAVSVLAEMIAVRSQRGTSSASETLLHSREPGTLCIVTRKKGSVPRGAGSMMLVTAEGAVDSIGGGEIEAGVLQEARKGGGVRIVDYKLDGGELGMSCGGEASVLLIPLREEEKLA